LYGASQYFSMFHSYDDAEDEYRAALRANESFEWAHNNLGLMLMNVRGDYDGAEKEFRRAIDLDPTYTWARNNLGLLLYEVRVGCTMFVLAVCFF